MKGRGMSEPIAEQVTATRGYLSDDEPFQHPADPSSRDPIAARRFSLAW